MEILTGIGLGLSTLLFIGPVFFYILESSIVGGKRAGIIASIGVLVGDVICVGLILAGFTKFIEGPEVQKWMAISGAVTLLFFGVKNFFKPSIAHQKEDKQTTKSSDFVYFTKAFVINFVNPFVFIVWIGFSTYLKSIDDSYSFLAIGLISAVIVILLTDCLKAFFADKLTALLSEKNLILISKVVGGFMLIFSLRLFYYFFSL